MVFRSPIRGDLDELVENGPSAYGVAVHLTAVYGPTICRNKTNNGAVAPQIKTDQRMPSVAR